MANLQCSCLLTLITFILLSFGHYAAARTEAFREIHNIMIKPRHDRSLGTVLIPRNWDVDSVAAIESPSPLAVVKRILLGRQGSTCDPGYSLCRGLRSRLKLQT